MDARSHQVQHSSRVGKHGPQSQRSAADDPLHCHCPPHQRRAQPCTAMWIMWRSAAGARRDRRGTSCRTRRCESSFHHPRPLAGLPRTRRGDPLRHHATMHVLPTRRVHPPFGLELNPGCLSTSMQRWHPESTTALILARGMTETPHDGASGGSTALDAGDECQC